MLDFFFPLFKLLGIVFLCWTVLSFIFRKGRTFAVVHTRWHHTFDDMKVSPQEFYHMVTDKINEKEIPGIEIDTVSHAETSIVSARRAYLQVKRDDQMFLICSAPFGTQYFISWWFGSPTNVWDEFWVSVPFFGAYIDKVLRGKTYYQMDSDSMFKDTIKGCVLEAIDDIASEKGYRMLSDTERMPIDKPMLQHAY